MRYFKPYLVGAFAAVLPFGVAAQDISGAATFGYGHFKESDGFPSTSVRSLDGKLGLAYDNGLLLGANASSARANFDGIDEDASLNVFGLTAGAAFANFWNAGAYYEYGEVSVDGFGEESLDSYGLFLGYSSDLMGMEFFLGETDGYVFSDTDIKWNDLGARVSFNIGPDAVVGGHAVRSRVSTSGVDIDLTSYGLGGSYDFGNGLSAHAGVTRGEIDVLVGDLTTFGIGVGYDLSAAANFPATLSVELARSRIDDGMDKYDADSIRFGVTLPFGGAKTVPLNSIAAGAMSPNRTALTSVLVGTF